MRTTFKGLLRYYGIQLGIVCLGYALLGVAEVLILLGI
jgi:hypothetical protein